MLSWVEYEKSFITSGPSPVWTFIEDVCAYSVRRLTKILCGGPNYESIFAHFLQFHINLIPKWVRASTNIQLTQ